MTTLAALPTHLLQVILSNSGRGGPAAAMTCKALSDSWRNALTLVPLAARYLLARYGPLTAARHLYLLSHHTQLLKRASSRKHDGIMVQLLQQLSQAGAEVALHDALLMVQAARAGHACMVLELICAAKPSIFALSRALTAAAETGRRDIVRYLLKAGAPPAAYQSAALVAAATSGDSEVVYMLCAAGADPTVDDSRALRRAVQLGHTEAARVLLLYGADARALCSASLLHACEVPPSISMPGTQSREPRSAAARKGTAGDTSLAAMATAATPTAVASGGAAICDSPGPGNDVDQVCNDHERCVLELLELLLRAGADARSHGRSSLEAAAARGYTCVVAALLAAGADPAACNSSALVAASIQGHTGVVNMLLESGADPWDVTDLALCTASERGHRPVLRIIRAAQIAASTAEELLLGSSCGTAGSIPGCGNGGGGGGDGDGEGGTPRLVTRLGSSRWSVSPSQGAAAGRWSLHMAMQSGYAMGLLTASGGAAGLFPMQKASLEAFLSNM